MAAELRLTAGSRCAKSLLLAAVLAMASLAAWAQGPNGSGKYYRQADGKCGAELKTALCRIIRLPKVVGYGGLKEAYCLTDVRPDGTLRDWYSSASSYEPGSNMSSGQKEEGMGYNREHLLPQSWFGSKKDPMYSDIVHVVPADAKLNSIRNDNPFGEVTSQKAQVGTSKGGYSRWGAPADSLDTPQGLTKVFEPNDEIKGDIARTYFYMITCYEDTLLSWPWRNSRTATFVFDESGTPYEPLQQWVMHMLMRWSESDPIDSVELARNNAVWRVQGNRNPYVDYPGLEQYVWGNMRHEPFVYAADGKPADDGQHFASTLTISLNSDFFGGEWVGARPARASSVLRGEQDGVKVEYALGNEGRNMYLGKDHIRLYQRNILSFSAENAVLDEITFNVTKNDAQKALMVGEETLSDYRWEGSLPQVDFHLDDGNGVFYLKEVTIYRTQTQGIADIPCGGERKTDAQLYDLCGRRVDKGSLRRGLYIANGKKYAVRR